MEFVSVARAAQQLGLARQVVGTTLAASGLGRPSGSTVDGAHALFDREAFEDLATRPFVDTEAAPDAIVVKLGAPRDDVDGRPIGYSVTYDDACLLDAYRMYWRVAFAEGWVGAALVAVICGFVVGMGEIRGIVRHPGGLVEFVLADPSTDVSAAFEGRRLRTRPGSVIEYLGDRPG